MPLSLVNATLVDPASPVDLGLSPGSGFGCPMKLVVQVSLSRRGKDQCFAQSPL